MASLLATSPLLSPNEAHLVAFSLTSAYVGGLYLSRLSLSSQSIQPRATGSEASKSKDETPLRDLVEADAPIELDRDDPRVIKSRCKAVGLATVGGCVLVGGIIYYRGDVRDLRATVSFRPRRLVPRTPRLMCHHSNGCIAATRNPALPRSPFRPSTVTQLPSSLPYNPLQAAPLPDDDQRPVHLPPLSAPAQSLTSPFTLFFGTHALRWTDLDGHPGKDLARANVREEAVDAERRRGVGLSCPGRTGFREKGVERLDRGKGRGGEEPGGGEEEVGGDEELHRRACIFHSGPLAHEPRERSSR